MANRKTASLETQVPGELAGSDVSAQAARTDEF